MSAKHNFRFYIIAILLFVSLSPSARAVTVDELADICQTMESAISDICLEYEWYVIPPWTIEEGEREMKMPMLAVKDGFYAYKLSAAGLSSKDPNDTLPEQFLFEEATTIIDKDGHTWDDVIKKSYNSRTGGKYLHIDEWPQKRALDGIVSDSKPDIFPTPIKFFSVLRFRMTGVIDNKPLSVILRQYKELVRLDNTITKVNGFNTIRADFLQEQTKEVCMRVYFSVDHGYTPVRYEYVNKGTPDLTFEVNSLEQVAKGLWFPSSGAISTSDSERVNVYQATGKILVNQGLTDKHFNIEFPPGTKVWDKVRDLKYVVKPTEEQSK